RDEVINNCQTTCCSCTDPMLPACGGAATTTTTSSTTTTTSSTTSSTTTSTTTTTLRFVDSMDGTVTDNETGLQWKKKDNTCPGIHCVNDAYSWCVDADNNFVCDNGGLPDGTAFTSFLAMQRRGDWRRQLYEREREHADGRVCRPLRLAVADDRGAADDPRCEPRLLWRWQRRVYRPDVRADRGVRLLVVYYLRRLPGPRVGRGFRQWVRGLRLQGLQLLRPR